MNTPALSPFSLYERAKILERQAHIDKDKGENSQKVNDIPVVATKHHL